MTYSHNPEKRRNISIAYISPSNKNIFIELLVIVGSKICLFLAHEMSPFQKNPLALEHKTNEQ